MGELRDVRATDAINAFVKAGGQARSGRGSHVNIKMPNGVILTFAIHRSAVKVGILRAMIKKSGVSEEEFLQFLGRR